MQYNTPTRIRTASKFGRDGSSLSKRRIWYADKNGDGQEAQSDSSAQSDASESALNGDKPWTLESAMAEIKKLRSESKTSRETASDAQKKLSAAAEAEQKRLIESGQWETLAKTREQDLAALMPYKQKAESYEQIITAGNQRMIAQVPEGKRKLIPMDYPPERLQAWLIDNQSELQRKAAPDLDAGAGSGGSGAVALTDEDKANARRAGMTDEEWRKQKAKLGQS